MVEHKDVILALLGASAGLAGLALVFLGFVLNSFEGFGPDTSEAVLGPWRSLAGFVIGAFGAGIATVALAAVWLVADEPDAVYIATIVAFFGLLLLLSVGTGICIRKLVWGGDA